MSQEGSTSTGSNIVVAGLFVQIVFFDLFFITEMRFALYEKAYSVLPELGNLWKFSSSAILITGLTILTMSILRFSEFIQGSEGHTVTHKYFLCVCDIIITSLCHFFP